MLLPALFFFVYIIIKTRGKVFGSLIFFGHREKGLKDPRILILKCGKYRVKMVKMQPLHI
jgi:hypothetical protein